MSWFSNILIIVSFAAVGNLFSIKSDIVMSEGVRNLPKKCVTIPRGSTNSDVERKLLEGYHMMSNISLGN